MKIISRETALIILALTGLPLAAVRADVTVTSLLTEGLNEPYSVAVDSENNVYASDSANNRIVRLDANTQALTTLAGIPTDPPGSNDGPFFLAHLNNPEGLLDASFNGEEGLLVTDNGNSLIRFVRLSDGYVTTLAGQAGGGPAIDATGANATFRFPAGLDQDGNGNVYIADWGNNMIRVMNLDDPLLGVTNLVIDGTTLYHPTAVACATNDAGQGEVWVADTGDNVIKLITLDSPVHGTLTTVLGAQGLTGTADSWYGASARFNGPSGLLWIDGYGLLISDTLNNSLRVATNFPAFGATNYAVYTFAGTPGPANGGLVDGPALSAKFSSPCGMALDSFNNGFLVADLRNNAIRRIQLGAPLPPVPPPQIGWVDFQLDSYGNLVSVLRTNQPFAFNNDVTIAIAGASGSLTYFTYGATPANPLQDTIPDPSADTGSTPPAYHDGMSPQQVQEMGTLVDAQPDFIIKAVGTQKGRVNSSISSARFQFQTAAPTIGGLSALNITLSEVTSNAQVYYTLDGSTPAPSNPASLYASANPFPVPAMVITSNLTVKARAFRPFYADSATASKIFYPSNALLNANTITFGFENGEASSEFIASPGQLFYAPVTLSVQPGTLIYSLQFNVTVTNAGANPGPAVAPGAFDFQSFLMKPAAVNTGVPPHDIGEYEPIPPLMFSGDASDPPPANVLTTYDGQPFVNMVFTNSSAGLLGVGWLERWGQANLYPTLLQDLIQYSMAHDTLFQQQGGRVILGTYAFHVPSGALPGQTYQIQLGRPSATSDGVGAPGSEVFIDTPSSGSLTNGAMNSIKRVTAGQPKYLVGDCAPFRWFNAGDFGDWGLDNADVMQVFQSAVYSWDTPLPGSDFFDSMDSCGGTYTDLGDGYLEFNQALTGASAQDALFNGDDTTINQIAFGDGKLDVCDVYVTFRRSLDPSLVLFERFWTNGVRVARAVGDLPASVRLPKNVLSPPPAVSFVASDALVSAGQTVRVPITARIAGSYPLRVLMLNLSVEPLDGSPPLTAPVQFAPAPALGEPTLTDSEGANNYAATWLDSTIPGLTGDATVGTLTFQIPANANANAAYAVHFDHASASPNGLASFPEQTSTGLITLSDRSNSSFNDGIPDSWRLRYFGTVSNLLSQAGADADGDGANNWQEYVAGTDPLDAASCLRLSWAPASQTGAARVLRWPTVAGKRYILETSTDLYTPDWIPVSTNSGSGAPIEFQASPGTSPALFYRVRIAP